MSSGMPTKNNQELWEYDTTMLTLTLSVRPWYEIDLERCNTSGQVLDWIIQVSKKTWATSEILGALVRALNRCLDIQGNICPCGSNQELNTREWLQSEKGQRYFALHSEEFEEFFRDYHEKNYGHKNFVTLSEMIEAENEFLKAKGLSK